MYSSLIIFKVNNTALLIMVLLQGLCYVVDITMVFLTFIGIFFSIKEYTNGIQDNIHSYSQWSMVVFDVDYGII